MELQVQLFSTFKLFGDMTKNLISSFNQIVCI